MKIRSRLLFLFIFIAGSLSLYAQDKSTGMTWGETYPPFERLLVDENFQGFDFFFNGQNTVDGNSKNELDPNTGIINYGYKNDTVDVPILGSENGKFQYYFYQCAFAPDWKTTYAAIEKNGITENSPNVSDGFVEISRPDSVYSDIPTIRGYFTVDLRAADFIEVIQWSHSSTGATKRGTMCQISTDDGLTWDTLRYQPAESSWALSFHKDPFTKEKTYNTFRCDPAAWGMTWEDGIYSSNVMLRFTPTGIPIVQTLRIHDLKIYGTYTEPTAAKSFNSEELKIFQSGNQLRLSKLARVAVYNLNGALVRSAARTNVLGIGDLPNGIYFVKAQAGLINKTSKIYIY